jgi:hypothetical protein
MRATQPSFGSIVLAGLILTGVRVLGLLIIALRRFPAYLPLPVRPFLQPLVFVSILAVGYLENATSSLSTHALAYLGLTGDSFFPSARRAAALTAAVNTSVAKYKRKFKNDRMSGPSVTFTMLDVYHVAPFTILAYAPLTLTLPFALTTYLFVANTLGAPQYALWAAILGGGVTALVGLFCVGLVDDTVDALYICYCVDQQTGQKRRPEVFNAVRAIRLVIRWGSDCRVRSSSMRQRNNNNNGSVQTLVLPDTSRLDPKPLLPNFQQRVESLRLLVQRVRRL